MLPWLVRIANVMHLELKRVLQVVARLLTGKTRHDDRPVGHVHDYQASGFGQPIGKLA